MKAETNRRSDRTQAITRAALDLFTQKGFQAAGIEQIAAAAGIGKSTVYDYYPSKEALFEAAVQEAADRWIAEFVEIGRQTADTVERLHRIADLFMSFLEAKRMRENRLFLEVVRQTVSEGGIFYKRRHLVQEIHQRIIRVIVDYLLTGVSRGQLRADIARHAEKIAINFIAYLDGIQLHSMVAGNYMDARRQVRFFMKNLIPLLRPEAESAAASGETLDPR